MKVVVILVPLIHLLFLLFSKVSGDIVINPETFAVQGNSLFSEVKPGTFTVLTEKSGSGDGIERVVLRKSVGQAVAIDLLITALLIALFSIVAERKKNMSAEAPVFVPYEQCEIEHSPQKTARSDFERLQQFIAVEYKNSAISLEFVESSLNLPQHRIRSLLRETLQVNFKQYVTELRMAEAKRLLATADYKIQDVAQAVGYLHTTTFNHVFKEVTGNTPRSYRVYATRGLGGLPVQLDSRMSMAV